jgi:protein-tyrosine-phosphatase
MEVLKKQIERLSNDLASISTSRKKILNQIINAIIEKLKTEKPVQLMFVCTHNSRRSQFGQIWSILLADQYGVDFEVYSGGTEVTKVYPGVIHVFQQLGVKINPSENQRYNLRVGDKNIPIYSKRYDDHNNPKQDFIAIMTCSEASDNCPFISGCDLRIALPYEDPKAYDGSAKEKSEYASTSNEIARELIYVFHNIKPKTT